MPHPFEQRQNILWLGAVLAVLATYFFLAIPNGSVPMMKVQAAAVSSDMASVSASHAPASPQRGANSVPLEGLIVALTFGAIAAIASISPFVGALSRRKTVQWVGPRSR